MIMKTIRHMSTNIEGLLRNMKGKKIITFSIPGLKKGEKVNYSTNHNDIYDAS